MIEFRKIPDEKNPYDMAEIRFIIPDELTIDKMRELFDDFLKAIGFHVEEDKEYGQGI